MKRAVILVHYQTPQLLRRALAAASRALVPVGGGELIVVDNGSAPGSLDGLSGRDACGHFVRVLEAPENLGYAGGLNYGIERSEAGWLVAMNPDVLVDDDCFLRLVAADPDSQSIAGPRFYWTEARRLMMPPADSHAWPDALLGALAGRPGSAGRWAQRSAAERFRRHARRHWQTTRALESHALSGALLAFPRAILGRIGPFDRRYQLYFEETEWLMRARAAGVPAFYVPDAVAVHLHARSTRHEPLASAWFEQSARRFRRERYGRLGARLLELLAGAASGQAAARPEGTFEVCDFELDLDAVAEQATTRDLWVEVSPEPSGVPAVGECLSDRPPSRWVVPTPIADNLEAGDSLRVAVTDHRLRELANFELCGSPRSTGGG